MDGCPLGLGLVIEDKPTEFSCMSYVNILGAWPLSVLVNQNQY